MDDSWYVVVRIFKDMFRTIKVTVSDNIEKLGVDSAFLDIYGREGIEHLKQGDLIGSIQDLTENPNVKLEAVVYFDSNGVDISFKLCEACNTKNDIENIFCKHCGAKFKEL